MFQWFDCKHRNQQRNKKKNTSHMEMFYKKKLPSLKVFKQTIKYFKSAKILEKNE